MQMSKSLCMLAGLTAFMLVLVPLGRAQMEEETTDAYSDSSNMGGMASGNMGSMGQMGGQMGGHMGGMSAMGEMGRGGMMAEMSSENLKQRLGLTDDQAAKLKSLRSTYLKETTMQGAKVRVAELELDDLLDEKTPDVSKIEKKVKEIEGLKGELMMQRIRSLLKAADFLSPEQFAQLRAMTMHRMGAMRPMGKMPYSPAHPPMHPPMNPTTPSGTGPHGTGPMPGMSPNQ